MSPDYAAPSRSRMFEPLRHDRRQGARLTDTFINWLDVNNYWPTSGMLLGWVEAVDGEEYGTTWMTIMRRGECVPTALALRLHDYVSRLANRPGCPPVDQAVRETRDTPPRVRGEAAQDRNFWTAGWWLAAQLAANPYVVQRENRVSAEELPAAVEMILDSLGRSITAGNVRMSVAEAVRRGGEHCGMHHGPYVEWLRPFHAADPHVVLFPTIRDRRGNPVIAGLTCVIPVSEGGYQRVMRREASVFDLTSADFERPTRRLHTHALSIPRASDCPRSNAASVVQGRSLLWQHAYFSPPLAPFATANCPTPFFFSSNPDNRDRGSRYGYQPTGVTMRGTSFEIVQLSAPEDRPAGATFWDVTTHVMMNTVLYLFQLGQHHASQA